MLRLNSPDNTTALVLSAAPAGASRASLVTGCAIVALGELHAAIQRIELSSISPAALFGRLPSDKLSRAAYAVERADVIVLIVPVAGAAYSGLFPAFLDNLPDGSLAGKTVVPFVLGGEPGALSRFESTLRRRLESAGANVALGELLDASDDFTGGAADEGLARRIERAIAEGLLPVRQPAQALPIQPAEFPQPVLIAC